jgi:hypothetical protein
MSLDKLLFIDEILAVRELSTIYINKNIEICIKKRPSIFSHVYYQQLINIRQISLTPFNKAS